MTGVQTCALPILKLALKDITHATVERIKANRKAREDYLEQFGGDKKGPYIYVIVATGNIYEDVIQAVAAARQGADVVAVIRTTVNPFVLLDSNLNRKIQTQVVINLQGDLAHPQTVFDINFPIYTFSLHIPFIVELI